MKINIDRFKELYRYKRRLESGHFLIEGKKNIDLAIKFGFNPLLYSCELIDGYEQVTSHQIKGVTGNYFVKEIGICRNYEANFDFNQVFFIFDNIVDYGNIGTIIRTIYSFGFKNLIFIVENNDIWHHKTIEASRGLIFAQKPFYETKEKVLEILKNNNIKLVNIDINGEDINSYSFPKSKYGFVFGNETNGISSDFKLNCIKTLTIPTHFESLNVAIAAGIVSFNCKFKN